MNLMWTILKVFIDLLQYCFCLILFYFIFCHEACGILDPQPEIVPDPPALEGLSHWATREVPIYRFKLSSLGRIPFVSEDSADLSHTGVT